MEKTQKKDVLSTNTDSELTLSPMLNLVYDIDDIDGQLYMFDHACSGSVMLQFSDKVIDTGSVFLNSRVHSSFETVNLIFGGGSVLCVHVRGYLNEYDTTASLHVEGFHTAAGTEMKPADYTIRIAPRKNSYPEEYHSHDEIAFRAAAESMVLLENNNVLPLRSNSVLNLFGSGVAEYRSCAVGAGRINPRGCRSLLQAITETSDFVLNEELTEFYRIPNNKLPSEQLLNKARNLSDTAIFVLSRGTGENIDNRAVRGEYYLTYDEETLITKLTSVFLYTVVVLNTGYPVDVRFLKRLDVDACIYSGYSGMFGADVLVSVLNGTTNPSGRLPDTWALDYYDIPSSRNFLNFGEKERVLQTDDRQWSRICYEEGRYIGYRYFTSFDIPCAYPFGYGLSYTSFKTECVEFSTEPENFDFSVQVTNTGNTAGQQAIQIYASKPEGALDQAASELIAFSKTTLLKPQQTQIIKLSVPLRHLASYDDTSAAWVLCAGEYSFWLGENSQQLSVIEKYFQSDVKLLQRVTNLVKPHIQFNEMTRKEKELPKGKFTVVSEKPIVGNSPVRYTTSSEPLSAKSIGFDEIIKDTNNAAPFVRQLSDYELCRLLVCSNKSWGMEEKGEAGWIANLQKYGMPSYVLADGNNGINVKKPNIGMPSSCMIAASFNPQIALEVGKVIAAEALENGVDLVLGPAMNIHRNPLNGRGAEYFSEDPLLTGVMAGYQNKGFQQNGVSGCLKHVVANNCEALRKRSDSVISERTLREIYISPFEYAMEIEPADTIMTGYNAVNGCFTDENTELLEEIFRNELRFDGFAMSDWNSYDTSDMAAMVRAGISLLTPGSDDDKRVTPLLEALQDGSITRAELERNAKRLITVIAKRLKCRNAITE